MTILITDTGFSKALPNLHVESPLEKTAEVPAFLDLRADTLPSLLPNYLACQSIRIAFPSFADGRGFTLAKRLRDLGYMGKLRAYGHVLADQYAMARRCGFDDVEISDELAERQTQEQWQSRANWSEHCYQTRLGRSLPST